MVVGGVSVAAGDAYGHAPGAGFDGCGGPVGVGGVGDQVVVVVGVAGGGTGCVGDGGWEVVVGVGGVLDCAFGGDDAPDVAGGGGAVDGGADVAEEVVGQPVGGDGPVGGVVAVGGAAAAGQACFVESAVEEGLVEGEVVEAVEVSVNDAVAEFQRVAGEVAGGFDEYADGSTDGCVVAGVVAPVEDVGEHTAGADLGGDAAVVIVAVVIRSTVPAG